MKAAGNNRFPAASKRRKEAAAMEKFIPFEKLSRKQKRERNAARRGGWGGLSPVTRRPENPKAYKRKKTRYESEEDAFDRVLFCLSA